MPHRRWITTIHRRQAKTWPSMRIASCAGCSGDFLPPSPPAEKTTVREDQIWKASASNGAWNAYRNISEYEI